MMDAHTWQENPGTRHKIKMLDARALQRFGYCFSGQSLRALFLRRYLLRKGHDFDWRAQNAWGVMLSFDHSLKVLKAMNLQGGQVLNNRATIMDNATGCILGGWSTATTSMDDDGLTLAMEDFMELAQDGRHEIKCLWIDNPYRDLAGAQRRFKVTTHAGDSAKHDYMFDGQTQMVTIVHTRKTDSFAYQQRMAIEHEAKTDSLVITQVDAASESCFDWFLQGATTPHYMGFDMEWTTQYKAGEVRRTALVQLALGKKCLLLRVHKIRTLPPELIDLLRRPGCTLLGRNILSDIKKMYTDFNIGFEGGTPDFLDLGSVANRVLMTGKIKWSLKRLTSEVLKKNLNKEIINKEVGGVTRGDHSVWGDDVLPEKHVCYAINDAAVATCIHEVLEPQKYDDPRRRKAKPSDTCPKGHSLKLDSVQENTRHVCDLCSKGQPVGTLMHGCRQCDWDMCDPCAHDRSQKEKRSFASLEQAGAINSSGPGSSEGGPAREKEKSMCPLCGQGVVTSSLEVHVNACWDKGVGTDGKGKGKAKAKSKAGQHGGQIQAARTLSRPNAEGLRRYFVAGGFCGPSWGSRGYMNTCPVDTTLFLLNAWHSFHPNSRLSAECEEQNLIGQCMRLYQEGIRQLLETVALLTEKGPALSNALQSALDIQKHSFMKTLSTFRDPEFKNYLCKYQKHDCSSSIMACLQPFLQHLGAFCVQFTRVCTQCNKGFCFEQSCAMLTLPARWRFQAHPKYAGESPRMSMLVQDIIVEIPPNMEEEAMLCTHCNCRNGRYISKRIVKRKLTMCSSQFFVYVAPQKDQCQVIQPILEGKITVPVNEQAQELYLTTLIFWPGYGHFMCLQYLYDVTSPGWYSYDGLKDRQGPGLRCNAQFLGKNLASAAIHFEELVLLGYSAEPTVEHAWEVSMITKTISPLLKMPSQLSTKLMSFAGFDPDRVQAAAEGRAYAAGGLELKDVRALLRANERKAEGKTKQLRQALKALLIEVDHAELKDNSDLGDTTEEKRYCDEMALAIEMSLQHARARKGPEKAEREPWEGKQSEPPARKTSLETKRTDLVCEDEVALAAAVVQMGLLQNAENELAADGLMAENEQLAPAVKQVEVLSLEDAQRALIQYHRTDSLTDDLRMPTSLTSDERKSLHELADALELGHRSEGEASERTLIITKQGTEKEEECPFDPDWHLVRIKYDIKHFLGNVYTMARTGSKYYATFCSTIADAVLVPLPGEKERVETHFQALGMTPAEIKRLPRRAKRALMRHAVLEPSKLYQRLKSVILLFSLLREPETGRSYIRA